VKAGVEPPGDKGGPTSECANGEDAGKKKEGVLGGSKIGEAQQKKVAITGEGSAFKKTKGTCKARALSTVLSKRNKQKKKKRKKKTTTLKKRKKKRGLEEGLRREIEEGFHLCEMAALKGGPRLGKILRVKKN